ncbi:MAG TPA: DUF6259 domain-containing protein [Acidobacteriaceae bacterium]|nr:DUF6259 domain-containing protein [Acidobacteriaceae bacterium]
MNPSLSFLSYFHKHSRLAASLTACLLLAGAPQNNAQQFQSGQDSPVHDSDRLQSIGPDRIILENSDLRIDFDKTTGALTHLENKHTHWSITPRPEVAESFTLFAPTAERSYNPVLGSRNYPVSINKSADGRQLILVWDNLTSEYSGTLKIHIEATVTLNGPQLTFAAKVDNHSPNTVASLEWPILGDLKPPTPDSTLTREYQSYGGLSRHSIYPIFSDERGDYGTNYPMQVANNGGYGLVRYILIDAESSHGAQGLYLGTHDTTGNELVSYTAELKPGYETSYQQRVPETPTVSNHPARIVFGATHFPFVNPGESITLAPVVLSPYQGDWHSGVDIHKQWKATWFHEPPSPAWVHDVNAWQQLQIDSSEDDLRTPFRDLPRRAQEDAANGIAAIQLVGWNKGGQDRDNPSFQPDPRLGTFEELKSSIAAIEKTGVHMILFQKYTWADLSTPEYGSTLHNHVALDPYGIPYQHQGYDYQTPEQLNHINTRRFAPGCTADNSWLDLAAKEFQTTLDLGATGMLYDEVFHHGGAFYCFSPDHGHHSPASLWPGDQRMGARFRSMAAKTFGEDHFLFSGEDPYDLEEQNYTLSYFRISPGNIPAERYAAPFRPMMVAVSGFDDREMVNRALKDRYILSYEPFRFKGNLTDFPLTLDYGKKMDALRRRYRQYLWDAEFRDTLGATVTSSGKPWPNYSVFRTQSGQQAIVLINDEQEAVNLSVQTKGPTSFRVVTPESPDPKPTTGAVTLPARSALVLLPQ